VSDDLVIARSDLGRLDPIGRGGTAMVYGLPDLAPAALRLPALHGLVYKEYKQKVLERAGPGLLSGLRTLVALRLHKLVDEQRARWDQRIVWPLRVVTDAAGAATGIVMPLIPPPFFQRTVRRSGPPQLRPREVEKLFGDVDTMRRTGLDPLDTDTRVTLVGRIASTYAMMHRAGIVIGDINGRNLIYDPARSRPAVMAVDADSARPEGTRSVFETQPYSPQWQPPEVLAAIRRYQQNPQSTPSRALTAQNKQTDLYKFGLLAVRILDYGRRRAVNRDPTRAVEVLRRSRVPEAAELLRATLAENPKDRPTLREWYEAMNPGRSRSSTDSAIPPPGVAGTQVSGAWTLIEGVGWVRRQDQQ
jgi:hypothetical protein